MIEAMSTRVWDEPLNWPVFEGSGTSALSDEVSQAVADGADTQTPEAVPGNE